MNKPVDKGLDIVFGITSNLKRNIETRLSKKNIN